MSSKEPPKSEVEASSSGGAEGTPPATSAALTTTPPGQVHTPPMVRPRPRSATVARTPPIFKGYLYHTREDNDDAIDPLFRGPPGYMRSPGAIPKPSTEPLLVGAPRYSSTTYPVKRKQVNDTHYPTSPYDAHTEYETTKKEKTDDHIGSRSIGHSFFLDEATAPRTEHEYRVMYLRKEKELKEAQEAAKKKDEEAAKNIDQ